MSLAYADSPELMAYAYANRSAALYRKQLYKECLMDINTALSLGYPEEKSRKLKERGDKALAEIVKSMGHENGGANTSENPFDSSAKDTETSRKFPLIKSVRSDTEIKEQIEDGTSLLEKPKYLIDDGPPQLIYGPSKEAPSASDGVQISFSEKFGRHLIATKEFRPGDVMAVEEPFAAIIYEER